MKLETNVTGYILVSKQRFNDATNRLHEIDRIAHDLRKTLLKDMSLLEHKNTFAKTVRLLGKLHDKIGSVGELW